MQRANTSKSIKKQISIASFGGDAAAEAAAEAEEAAAAAEAERLAAELEMDKQVRMAQRVLKEHMTTRFTHLTRAFRTIDEDKSGKLSRRELKAILITFNLGVGDKVLDRLIDLADYDGTRGCALPATPRHCSAPDTVLPLLMPAPAPAAASLPHAPPTTIPQATAT